MSDFNVISDIENAAEATMKIPLYQRDQNQRIKQLTTNL
jgi:hypothetical protein